MNKFTILGLKYQKFDTCQLMRLSEYGDVVAVNIPIIETVGGGSARCMLAEVFPDTV